MAKTQKQQLYDDLNKLIVRYPNMRASVLILTTQAWLNGVFHALPGRTKNDKRRAVIRDRTAVYRLG